VDHVRAGGAQDPPLPVTSFDLDGYLARIGWTGPREVTYRTMAGVLRAHMRHIPFENLDVLLGRGIQIDRDSVYAKLVAARRGGYCFEHGTLLQAALEQLGFSPVVHTARVILLRPRSEAPQTHMFLTVRLSDERYVLDPGFGGHGPLVPVPVQGTEVRDNRDVHCMVQRGDEWVLEAQIDGKMTSLWSSMLEPAEHVDFVMANHFVSTFSASPFVTNLMLRAITDKGRVSVMNRALTRRHDSGEEKHVLQSRAALRTLLNDDFGFDLPDIEDLRVPSMPEWT
jgi:N-hydroxyarylamine O-acetyltransferase